MQRVRLNDAYFEKEVTDEKDYMCNVMCFVCTCACSPGICGRSKWCRRFFEKNETISFDEMRMAASNVYCRMYER